MSRAEELLERRLDDHRAAVSEFIEKADALDPAQWLVPRGAGKWTPAQETRHLMLAFEAFTRDLEGGAPVRLRGNRFKRMLWRWVGLSSILWRQRIPVAVKAPREARPEWETADAATLLPQMRDCSEHFHEVLARVWRGEPRRTVTHPMFGPLTLDHAIRLMCVHTRHHAELLPARSQILQETL
jgi:hypothetical protein